MSARALSLVLAGAATAAALACGPAAQPAASTAPAPQTDQPQYGGALTVRISTDMFDFDTSYVGQSSPNTWGLSLAYSNLLDFKTGPDVGYGEAILQPELAERWEVSPDARAFTFHLRHGVTFADRPPVNGRELTSADVKWSFEYLARTGAVADKKLPKSQGDWMFTGLEAIETPDPYTVTVRYKDPFAPFVYYAASERLNPIYPHEIYDADGSFQSRAAGTGAFQLDEAGSQRGTRWVFKKNPNYFEPGKPYLDEVRYLVIPDDGTAFAAFQAKQVDHIGDNISLQAGEDIRRGRPDGVMYRFAQPAPLQVFWNVQRAPLDDVRVRKAIAFAIDRDEFIKAFAPGFGAWGISGAIAGVFSQEELKSIEKFDPELSRRLLKEAGYPDGLSIDLNYPGDAYGQQYLSQMQLFQAQLKKAGINLVPRSQDKEAFSASKKTGEYFINLTPNANLEGDIGDWLFSLYHQDSRQNNNHVKDPELTARLVALQGIVDSDKRREEVRSLTRYVYDKAWGLAIFHGVDHFFWAPQLKGYTPNFWHRGPSLQGAWLER